MDAATVHDPWHTGGDVGDWNRQQNKVFAWCQPNSSIWHDDRAAVELADSRAMRRHLTRSKHAISSGMYTACRYTWAAANQSGRSRVRGRIDRIGKDAKPGIRRSSRQGGRVNHAGNRCRKRGSDSGRTIATAVMAGVQSSRGNGGNNTGRAPLGAWPKAD